MPRRPPLLLTTQQFVVLPDEAPGLPRAEPVALADALPPLFLPSLDQGQYRVVSRHRHPFP
ncbi:hypothetical protein Cus16_1606 [Curtobacterium sp. ER1/6]|nr:hypothetical protein Cus16_1606 [Curtobacterium sp. ER1/6]